MSARCHWYGKYKFAGTDTIHSRQFLSNKYAGEISHGGKLHREFFRYRTGTRFDMVVDLDGEISQSCVVFVMFGYRIETIGFEVAG